MPIDRCNWCDAITTNFCQRCGKAYCPDTCTTEKGEERNPAQPCAVTKKSVDMSKRLAAAGF
jgi:hypothetical protein